MKNLLIFDFDGVIADSAPFYMEKYREAAAKFGKIYPVETLNDFKRWYDSAWENNYVNLGFNSDETKEAVKIVRLGINYSDIPIFKGLKQALTKLSEKYILSIASCTIKAILLKKLEEEKILKFFSYVAGGDGRGSRKEAIINEVLTRLRVKPAYAIMIGDTEMDVKSAKVLGIPSIGAGYGWQTKERLFKAGASAVADAPERIPELADKMFKDKTIVL